MDLRRKLKASPFLVGGKGSRKAALGWVVAFVLGYPALYLSAVLPVPPGFVVAITLVCLAEPQVLRRAPGLGAALRRAQLDSTHRTFIRDGALLLLAVRLERLNGATLGTLGVGLLALYLLRGVVVNRLRLLDTLRTLPPHTRNVDLSLRIPDAPPAWFGRLRKSVLPYTSVPVALGVVVAAFVPGALIVVVTLAGLGVSVIAAVALVAAVALAVYRNRHLTSAKVAAAVRRCVLRLRPEVIVYVSLPQDERASAYQVDQWLPTMRCLPRRTLIVVRERELLNHIAPTPLPIVCLPASADVYALDLPDLRVVFYVNHAGRNIHFLRLAGVRHIFINHGDSDKAASVNRFSKVYDEVWVAGPAARERYLRAGARLRDDELVEVGRPQIAGIQMVRAGSAPDRQYTVLYAPTWEGIADTFSVSSLTRLGLAVVRVLTELDPPVRVIFKPHPFTGRRDPAMVRASRRIATELEAANQRRVRGGGFADATAGHRTVTATSPDLISCFNEADLLISDVSAVVSDFLASAKPYLMINLTGLAEDEFRENYTAARAAYVLHGDSNTDTDTVGTRLAHLIQTLREPGDDELAAARRDLRAYLLGPAEPDPLTRFIEALQARFDTPLDAPAYSGTRR